MISEFVLSINEIIEVNSLRNCIQCSLRYLGGRYMLPIITSLERPPPVIFYKLPFPMLKLIKCHNYVVNKTIVNVHDQTSFIPACFPLSDAVIAIEM